MDVLLINSGSYSSNPNEEIGNLEKCLSDILFQKEKEKLKINGINEFPVYAHQVSRGLLCLASELKKKGFNPKYLQLDYESRKDEDLQELIKNAVEGIGIVGITSFTHNFYDAENIAREIKKVGEDIMVVVGGAHATHMYNEVLSSPFIDVVVRGEGEATFSELCSNIRDNKSLENIDGIVYKDANKNLLKNPIRGRLRGNEIPTPLYSILPETEELTMVLETARGCKMNCTFCEESSFWGNIRYRDISDVVEEISFLKNRKYNGIHISDPIFPLNKERVKELSNTLKKENVEMNFNCNARLEFLDEDMLDYLQGMNVYGIFVGIESCSNEVLQKMNKGITFEDYVSCLKKIRKRMLVIDASWMIGFPYETPKTLKETQERMKFLLTEGLLDSIWPKVFVPYPGTKPFHNPSDFDMTLLSRNWREYNRTSRPVYETKSLSQTQVEDAYQESLLMLIGELK